MADPTQTNISQTTIPDYAKPYVETLLGKADAVTAPPVYKKDDSGNLVYDDKGQPILLSGNPYKTYPGERTALFTDLQNQAFTGASNLGPASQLTDATSLAQKAGLGALGVNYGAGQFANQYGYTPDSFLGQGTAASYMNPYMQNVVDIQKREAQRASNIAGTQQQAQAVQAGAFGGSRDAIMRAERERNLATQLGDIQATGSNAAYNQAMQQFNAEQAARMQSAGMGAQYGQAANQLGEQSRQFGAGLGLQGLQTALQGAGALGNLGATQFGQQAQGIGIQGQLGGTQQQQQQNILNQQYQDFLTQKQYPYQQLGFMSDMLRGLPLSQSSTQMYSNPNFLTQAAGAVGTAYMGNKIFNGASGGLPEDFERKERPAGLAELAIYNMA
jgi:hypothetical protein